MGAGPSTRSSASKAQHETWWGPLPYRQFTFATWPGGTPQIINDRGNQPYRNKRPPPQDPEEQTREWVMGGCRSVSHDSRAAVEGSNTSHSFFFAQFGLGGVLVARPGMTYCPCLDDPGVLSSGSG